MEVEQVLQQLPAGGERRRHQLDETLRVIGRDVLVRERRAEQPGMHRLRQGAGRLDPQGLFFDAFAPALQDLGLSTIDERGKPPLEHAIDAGSPTHSSLYKFNGAPWFDWFELFDLLFRRRLGILPPRRWVAQLP